jgi:hypothetical protein
MHLGARNTWLPFHGTLGSTCGGSDDPPRRNNQGLTTREIAELIERMYGAHYSPQTISNMSLAMEEQAHAFHTRAVAPHYTVPLWLVSKKSNISDYHKQIQSLN